MGFRSYRFWAYAAAVALAMGLAEAQAPKRVPRIGVMLNTVPVAEIGKGHPFDRLFVEGLREHGWVNGSNVEIHYRSAEGRAERFAALFDELLALPVDILVTYGNDSALVAKSRTRQVPIVMATCGQPAAAGIVASLSRPGGNITGISLDVEHSIPKRLSLLKEIHPRLERVAVIGEPESRATRIEGVLDPLAEFRAAARALGLTLLQLEVESPDALPQAFEKAARMGANGALLSYWGQFERPAVQRDIHQLALRHRIAVMHSHLTAPQTGGLAAFGPDIEDNYRRASTLVHRILRGAKPAEIPIEQPTRYRFVVNAGAARELGLVLSLSVLAQADHVFP